MEFARESVAALGGASSNRIAILITFLAVEALLFLLQGPLIKRRIRPNIAYGLRVPATLADETVWYDANEATGRDMRRSSVICFGLCVIGFVAPISDGIYSFGMVAALLATTIMDAIVGWRRANRMLRERRATP